MSRCRSCDEVLTDFEACRKSVDTDEYIDLCNQCFNSINDDVVSVERRDLMHDYDDKPGLDHDQLDDYDYNTYLDNHNFEEDY